MRASLRFERRLIPLVYLGVSGFGAYHYLLRGEEIAAHEKDNQLNRLDETYQLSQTNPEVASQIRTELGAKPIDQSKLGGFNYNVSAYIKIEI